MHKGPQTRYDRELAAQGVGNMLCGLLGALPMTGVIVRSATNVEAGAKTRLSAVLHGVWLLLFVSCFRSVLNWVPTASLAAVLVYTGYTLVDVKEMRKLLRQSRSEFAILIVTMVTVVLVDLLSGVLLGVALSALKLLWRFSHLHIRREEQPERHRFVLHLEGSATFLRLPVLAAALEKVPSNTELHVHLEHLAYIDHACLELLMTWENRHKSTGGSLVIDWESLRAKFRSPKRPLAA
jgi:MFS superfamily sulfate permease-like transporter